MSIRRNERIQALVIKGTPQGESNKLTALFLADGRMINAVAHGARKPASRFGASLEPGTVIRAELRYGTSQDALATLSDGAILNSHQGLKQTLDGMGILFDFLGLLQYVCRCAGGDAELYRRSVTLLDHADQAQDDLSGILPMVRGAVLLHLGRMPDWTCCSLCRAPSPERVSLHGVYCSRCAALNRGETRPVDAAVAGLADRIARGEIPLGVQPWGQLDDVFDWMLEASGLRQENNRGYTTHAGR